MSELHRLTGEWTIEAHFPGAPPTGPVGRTVFEWMTGERFLIQRWEAPDPAPDGIAIIGARADGEGYLQHYFDSRGVARVYEMTLAANAWRLSRTSPDFSPLDFQQRFDGVFEDGGETIRGSWQTRQQGSDWEHDFKLAYRRVG